MNGSDGNAPCVAAIGARGTGKSSWIKNCLKEARPSRLLIWDPQDEFEGMGVVFTDRLALLDACVKRRTFAAIYRPGDQMSKYPERFNWFCRLAYKLGNLTLIVEELADVTAPQKAPEAWSVISRKGRHRNITLIAASQRPASIDKDFLDNCTLIHCGRCVGRRGAEVMAEYLDIETDAASGLKPYQQLMRLPNYHYFERSPVTGKKGAGVLPAPGK